MSDREARPADGQMGHKWGAELLDALEYERQWPDYNEEARERTNRAVTALLARVEQLQRERDERGPFFVRDIARLLCLPDDVSMDAIAAELAASRQREARLCAVVLAADAATRYPEDHEAFDALCVACERITDAELDALRAALAGEERAASGAAVPLTETQQP